MADLAAAAAKGQQGGPASLTEVSSNAKALYNCQAVAAPYKYYTTNRYRFRHLQHDHKLDPYLGYSPPYEVLLQEKVRQQQAMHEHVGNCPLCTFVCVPLCLPVSPLLQVATENNVLIFCQLGNSL